MDITEEEKAKIQDMVNNLVIRAKKASEEYMKLNQEQVNKIVKAMAMAGLEHHMELAKWLWKKREEEYMKIK